MHADTSAIRTFGDAQAGHAAALAAAGALVASAQPGDELGSAGAGFARALATAVRLHAERLARLSTVVADASAAAHANAASYVAADARNRQSIADVGA